MLMKFINLTTDNSDKYTNFLKIIEFSTFCKLWALEPLQMMS